MHYVIAFVITIMGTVMAALGESKNLYWLLVSDVNVLNALFMAWYFERHYK